MSEQLISRSTDLKRLRDEGYEVSVVHGHLLVDHVPYVTAERQVAYGTLVSTLTLQGDVSATPDTHVVTFAGTAPCDRDGTVLTQIINDSTTHALAPELEINFSFSSKPAAGYPDYYDKMTAYIEMLAGPARAIDGDATAQTFRAREVPEDESVFRYLDTASSRSGIGAATARLAIDKVAIVGLGGTGSYVLDFIAKTPVREIHLFDGDDLLQHNAFRAPGAVSLEALQQRPSKVTCYYEQYDQMRRGIHPHKGYVTAETVEDLRGMDFVFLCLDDGAAKLLIVKSLETFGIAFIDVGMGIYETDGALAGLVRVTASTPEQRSHIWERSRISFGHADPDNNYDDNIQIAELNALNAALAVIKWKKLVGFYVDLEREHFSVYEIDGNTMLNEDKP